MSEYMSHLWYRECFLLLCVYSFLIFGVFILQLSILVHPDKNQDDPDRAQKAFEGNMYLQV